MKTKSELYAERDGIQIVDGKLYHKNGAYGEREAIIQVTIGLDWQIIHIPAEKISANIQKLNDCILEILQHRGKNNVIR